MPMTWNAEADAKLFAAVMQVTDLKLSMDNLKKIKEIMGADCTTKALTHRIGKFKTLAKNGASDGAGAAADKKATAAAVPQAKGGEKAKKTDTPVEEYDDYDEENDVKPAERARKRKAAKSEKATDGEKGAIKKTKSEVNEEDAF